MKRLTAPELMARKGGAPIVALTAYTAPVARLLDPHVDMLLVGDSLGMVIYGMESTLPVTLDMMIAHGRAVTKASTRACVVVDMPFGSYQASPGQAFASCARVMAETGASAVKLEGGAPMAATIRFLSERGIPVLGHAGLLPQSVHRMGGYKIQGVSEAGAKAVMEDARAIETAGAFAVVLEGVSEPLARSITGALHIPTIGIGASPACDGQVLVTEDMAGFTARTPRFVKRYAELGSALEQTVRVYAEDVRARRFPEPQHCYANKE